MQTKLSVLLATLAATKFAQAAITESGVPDTCVSPCNDAILLSSSCSNSTSTDDGFNDCFCNTTSSHVNLLRCSSCISLANQSDSDVTNQLVECGFVAAPITKAVGTSNNDSDSAAPLATFGCGSLVTALFVGFTVLL